MKRERNKNAPPDIVVAFADNEFISRHMKLIWIFLFKSQLLIVYKQTISSPRMNISTYRFLARAEDDSLIIERLFALAHRHWQNPMTSSGHVAICISNLLMKIC